MLLEGKAMLLLQTPRRDTILGRSLSQGSHDAARHLPSKNSFRVVENALACA